MESQLKPIKWRCSRQKHHVCE